MGIEKQSKLNLLIRNWPDGKINSSSWLTSKGYGANFIQKYKNNNWIEAVGSGAYKKSGDDVAWASAVECLQKQLKSTRIHLVRYLTHAYRQKSNNKKFLFLQKFLSR